MGKSNGRQVLMLTEIAILLSKSVSENISSRQMISFGVCGILDQRQAAVCIADVMIPGL